MFLMGLTSIMMGFPVETAPVVTSGSKSTPNEIPAEPDEKSPESFTASAINHKVDRGIDNNQKV